MTAAMASGSAALTSGTFAAREIFTLSVPTDFCSDGYTLVVSWTSLVLHFLGDDVSLGSEARLWLRDRGPGTSNGVSFFAAILREVPVPGLAEVAPEECPDGLVPEVRSGREPQRAAVG